MYENMREHIIEFITREATMSELLACVDDIEARRKHDNDRVKEFARNRSINPVSGRSTLMDKPASAPPLPPTPTSVESAKPTEAVAAEPRNQTPPGKKLARIGETARGEILAALRVAPSRTLEQIGTKYRDHLYTFWQRGEVTYNGSTYALKEKK